MLYSYFISMDELEGMFSKWETVYVCWSENVSQATKSSVVLFLEHYLSQVSKLTFPQLQYN